MIFRSITSWKGNKIKESASQKLDELVKNLIRNRHPRRFSEKREKAVKKFPIMVIQGLLPTLS